MKRKQGSFDTRFCFCIGDHISMGNRTNIFKHTHIHTAIIFYMKETITSQYQHYRTFIKLNCILLSIGLLLEQMENLDFHIQYTRAVHYIINEIVSC